VLELRGLADGLATTAAVRIIPVLQGWTLDDYLAHADAYHRAGIDLAAEPVVGLGSVCRRQATSEIGAIVDRLHAEGIRLHGFGVKTDGLARYSYGLASTDSLAWSYGARRRPALPGCTGHKNCANCPRAALAWRAGVLARCKGNQQLTLPLSLPIGGVA
jgi:hypothetical protein